MIVEKLKRTYRYYFKNPPKARTQCNIKIERHGTIYGGWNIAPDRLNENSVVYSFGIGQDISFDLSIIKKYGCKVHGFDPTPKVIDWLESQNTPEGFLFYPNALSNKDGKLTFFSPANEQHISHTAHKSKNSLAVEVTCNRLSTIMKKLNHREIDLLKMDIEGFEYGVLKDMIAENIYPRQLLIEFHHFFPDRSNSDTEQAIEFLTSKGYKLFNISDSFCEYSFLYSKN